ncbi:MAG: hypothetical protein CSA34_05225 [Desulfobulbus propionicus]|nr:MAG: hypothetical protein CSA34_05225 [Desulfobulbus propionicus]
MAVQSIERAMAILMLFSVHRTRIGITEIARELQLTKPTVHGIVKTLEQGEFLQRDEESKKYSLGLAAYELGLIIGNNLEINQKAGELAQLLSQEMGLVCRVGVWSKESVLVVLNKVPEGNALFSHRYSPRIPAYCTVLGKAMLAFLPADELAAYLVSHRLEKMTNRTITDEKALRDDLQETLARGFAVTRGEYSVTTWGVAAPLFNLHGRLYGAISLSGAESEIFGAMYEKIIDRLIAVSRTISMSMGFANTPGSR